MKRPFLYIVLSLVFAAIPVLILGCTQAQLQKADTGLTKVVTASTNPTVTAVETAAAPFTDGWSLLIGQAVSSLGLFGLAVVHAMSSNKTKGQLIGTINSALNGAATGVDTVQPAALNATAPPTSPPPTH